MRIGPLLACAAAAVLGVSLVIPAVADTAPPPTLFVLGQSFANEPCSDTGPGTYGDPLCTVQAAANMAVPGQTVIVDTNMDNEFIGGDIDITRSGTPGASIVFETGDVEPETGLPSSVMINSGTNGFVLNGVHDVTIRGFGIQNIKSTGIVVSNSSDITIDHDFLRLYTPPSPGDGIDVSGASSNVTISRSSLFTDANDVSIGPGVTGTDIAENTLNGGLGNMVLVDGAANTDVTNNTAAFTYCPKPVFSVTGGATGTSLENNIVTGQCTTDSPLVTVDPTATASTNWDYNAVYDKLNDAMYSWGGTSCGTAASLATATGQATHDSNAVGPLGANNVPLGASVDSADANAPGILPTDYNGDLRVDSPSTPNTGTGIGYVDRGAVEQQDPMTLSVTTNTAKAPTGGTVVATVTAVQGWAPITGYTVDFGDGTPPVSSATPALSHVYTATREAPYRITATVTDTLGNSTTTTEPFYAGVTVVPPAPLVAVLDVGYEYQTSTMAFYAAISNTSTDSWSLISATCDFGDGTGIQQTDLLVCDHTYQATGTYQITMTVTDGGGNTATVSKVVDVTAPKPVAPPLPVTQPGQGGGHRCPTCY